MVIPLAVPVARAARSAVTVVPMFAPSVIGYALRRSKIPEATVQRLSIYLRYVTQLHRDGVKVVSSYDLSKGCGFKAAQVRKDFAYFGELGVRGVGYYVKDLYVDLKKILGLVDIWEVALVGSGHLGSALLAYRGFQEYGFVISVVFDASEGGSGSSNRDPSSCELVKNLSILLLMFWFNVC